MTEILIIIGFLFASLSAQHIGRFARAARLPLITGYLATGAIVGPFVLGWITRDAVLVLRPVDNAALAFIAFAAGSELYLKELRSRVRSISWIISLQVLAIFPLGLATILMVAPHVPFLKAMAFPKLLALALLTSSILVARSPSSAIAIISELRARGPFTKTIMSVTVAIDAVVMVIFATSTSVAHSLVAGQQFDPWFILGVVLDLVLSVNVGYLAGRVLRTIISTDTGVIVKTCLMLAMGLGIFYLSDALVHFSEHRLGWRIAVEPLLTCMIAGFVVTNFSRFRDEFSLLIHEAGDVIYLVFFTLVGASLALDTLIRLWPVALLLAGVRFIGLFLGALGGGTIAGDPPQHTRLAVLGYITQAGVSLGLAKDAAAEFPIFGAEFATLVVAVIVINQLVGPPLMKFAIRRVGESHLPPEAVPDQVRDVVIFGIDDQARAVARLLAAHNWKVNLVDLEGAQVPQPPDRMASECYLPEFNEDTLGRVVSRGTDAIIAMLGDDEENHRVCEICFEKFGIPRIVVRLNDLAWSSKLAGLGALVVEPLSAMVNLLDQFVRVPQLASMLMHKNPEHEVMQVRVADPDIEDIPLRELRLPPGVRVLGITRQGQPLLPQANTRLVRNDEVTLVGELAHLEELANRWGY